MPEADLPLSGKTILLGVTGSIAAFKAVELANRLVKAGAEVPVIMTQAAQEFIQPLSFEALTHRPVYKDMFGGHRLEPCHISLAEAADLLVIAPVTANTLAKLAQGFADELLTSVAMATRAPLLLAPAMNDGMWTHPATQANSELLRTRGARFVSPEAGRLASGKLAGTGRLAPVDTIYSEILATLPPEPSHVC